MDSPPSRRYVPAPAPTVREDAGKRLQLRLDMAKPSAFARETESGLANLREKARADEAGRASGAETLSLVAAEAIVLENSLRAFQRELASRERAVREQELRLDEAESAVIRRAAELADERILLEKQKAVYNARLEAGEIDPARGESGLRALRELRDEIDEQSRTLEESKEWLHEREAFLEESERTLFKKMQQQQERESELDQREDELTSLKRRLVEAGATFPPPAPV